MLLRTRKREHRDSPERLLGFSDALFSIAITFLALDLGDLPTLHSGEAIHDFLVEHLSDYAVYFATFLVVGFMWWRHRLVFRNIRYRTPAISWLNVFILALVAMLPYPASLLSASFGLGISLSALLLPLTLASYALWVLFELARQQHVMMPDVTEPTVTYVRSTVLSTSIIMTIGLTFAGLSWALESETWFYVSLASLTLLLIAPPVLSKWVFPRPDVYAATDVRDGSDEKPEVDVEARESGLNWWDKLRLESEGMRFAIFSDGVFAISATILALQLRPPDVDRGTISTEVILKNIAQVPWYAYLVTFLLIGLFWTHHVRLFEKIVRSDTVLLWLNLIVLMFVAFLPMPSELLELGVSNTVSPLLLYLTTISAISVFMSATRIYANHATGVEAQLSQSSRQRNAQTIRAIWFSASFVLPTIMVALTQVGTWSIAIPILLISRPILLRLLRPDLVDTDDE